ncbi:MAG: iron ABC transporter permease [Clostridiales bacterium]|nr:iron ABC transporter permease [Clostridiales bacterium]MDY5514489.1 iron ABC transporter permease [Candidatus Ventricola sp.]
MKRRGRVLGVCAALTLVLALLLLLSAGVGSVRIPPGDAAWILLTGQGEATQVSIIMSIRLPRALMAALLGGALALSGFLLQTFFANPIAGPFVLGVSSGAKLTVALALIVLAQRMHALSSWELVLAAFAGAMLSMGFVLLAARQLRGMASLLVAGVMIGYICSAITDFAVTFAQDAQIVNLHGWSQGSFSGMSWENVRAAAWMVGLSSLLCLLLAKPIGALQLGEAYAQSVGVPIRALRAALVVLSSVLSACVTAFAGPVSFVGIAAPFLVKRLLGTAKPLAVIPASFLGGAVFCVGCDLIARTAFAPTELSISTVTSAFGAPVVIALMLLRQRGRADG